MFSVSYFIAHSTLMLSSLIYPPLMTFVNKNALLNKTLGMTRFSLFFGFLALPLLVAAGMTI